MKFKLWRLNYYSTNVIVNLSVVFLTLSAFFCHVFHINFSLGKFFGINFVVQRTDRKLHRLFMAREPLAAAHHRNPNFAQKNLSQLWLRSSEAVVLNGYMSLWYLRQNLFCNSCSTTSPNSVLFWFVGRQLLTLRTMGQFHRYFLSSCSVKKLDLIFLR